MICILLIMDLDILGVSMICMLSWEHAWQVILRSQFQTTTGFGQTAPTHCSRGVLSHLKQCKPQLYHGKRIFIINIYQRLVWVCQRVAEYLRVCLDTKFSPESCFGF